MKYLLAICLTFVCSVASAELSLVGPAKDGALVQVASDEPGTWVIMQQQSTVPFYADSNGKTCVFTGPAAVYLVIQWSQGTPSTLTVKVGEPDDPPGPPNPFLTERAKKARDEAIAVNHPQKAQTITTLANGYKNLAAGIPGTVSGDDPIAASVKSLHDTVLTEASMVASWFKFRTMIGEMLDDIVQRGQGDPEYKKLFTEVSKGLEAALGGTQ